MANSDQSRNKEEREKQKRKKRQEKERKKEERKSKKGGLDDMIAYVDEFGNISSTPPDPNKKSKISLDDIQISVPKREDTGEEDGGVRKGVVTFFDTAKGYGFIRDLESQDSIFTHIKSHIDVIKEGDQVTFEVAQGLKGPNAVSVKKLS